jgi:hypothetical protein
VGDSISISDWANQKDTTTRDRVYPARRHGGSGVTRLVSARRTAGHRRVGSKVTTGIDVVEMGTFA